MYKYYPKKNHKSKQTAFGNTRSNPEISCNPHGVSVHLDYCRYSFFGSRSSVLDIINFILDYSFDTELAILNEGSFSIGKHTRNYRYQYSGFYGARLLYNLDNDDIPQSDSIHTHDKDYSELLLELPGSFFRGVSPYEQYLLIHQLQGRWKMLCNRIDIAIDDTTYHFSHDFLNQVQIKKNFAYVRSRKRIIDYAFDSENNTDVEVITHYFGSRESESFIRIYDCKYVHKFDSQRFECEFKGEKAKFISYALSDFWLDSDDENLINAEFQKKLAEFVTGSLLFIDRSTLDSSGNLSSADVLPEWQSYLVKIAENIVPVRVCPPREPQTVQRNDDWLSRQVANGLIVRLHAVGGWKKFNVWLKSVFESKAFQKNKTLKEYYSHLVSTDNFSAILSHHYTNLYSLGN